MDTQTIVGQIIAAQENGEPQAIYRKTILGKVIVKALDQFTGKAVDIILYGVPGKDPDEDIEICLWAPIEVKFFERYNKGLIEKGSLAKVDSMAETVINRTNSLNDDEIKELVSGNYRRLESTLSDITSEATLQRVYKLAVELNRPAKTLGVIQTRVEEVQQNDN